jgi:DNA-binding GntR family transcriptional regulator
MNKARILDYPVQKPLTLRERIVEFIKDAILSGKLAPGERVPEQEIAESFGISRTPIREAFRQLESEGFITVVPRKGAVVSAITAKDVADFRHNGKGRGGLLRHKEPARRVRRKKGLFEVQGKGG